MTDLRAGLLLIPAVPVEVVAPLALEHPALYVVIIIIIIIGVLCVELGAPAAHRKQATA